MVILERMPDGIVKQVVLDRVIFLPGRRQKYAAGGALEFLGPELGPAIPELAVIAGSKADGDASILATIALCAAGPAAWTEVLRLVTNSGSMINRIAANGLLPMGSNAVSAIPSLLGHLRGTNADAAEVTANVLGELRLEPASVVPALVQSLQSPEADVANSAATALANYGAKAAPALPSLAELAHSENTELRNSASNAVATITAAVAAEAPPR